MPGLLQIAPPPEATAPGPRRLSDDLSELRAPRDLDSLLPLARELIQDLSFPTVEAWRRTGGKVIGSFPVYTPQELVHALGMLPVLAQGGGEGIDIAHADAALGSFLCSISKSTLELALTGALSGFDGFVLPYICDVSRNLEGILARNRPELSTHMLHLPQNFDTPAALPFLVAEYRRLLAKLERIAGRSLDPEALRATFRAYNAHREELREWVALRMRRPQDLPFLEYYLVDRVGGLLPVELHTELLRRAREEVAGRSRRPRDALRVLLVGPFCEQPTLDLLELIESCGLACVSDELQMGSRWYGDLPLEGDPVESLARAYLTSAVDIGVRRAPRPKAQAIVERVRAADAQAVLFLTAKFCEPALEDVVLYRRGLEAERIPYLQLEFEEKSTTYEQARLQLETFVESQLFD